MTDSTRKPRAFDPDAPEPVFTEPANSENLGDDDVQAPPLENANTDPPPVMTRPKLGWGGLLAATLFALFGLATSVWFARFVSVTLTQDNWVGWLAWSLVGLGGLAATVLIGRELVGFRRLAKLTRVRRDAQQALRDGDMDLEAGVIRHLKTTARNQPKLRWDLERFREEERHMQTPGALLSLADRILLDGADKAARTVIYRTARRVAIVTAVVPVAFVVVLFVLFENLAMIRRLAGVYGGRPGFLGGIRLFWWIIGHIAATGMIALTDDLWGQFFGQDVARRVSKRLGEGAFNGALTARLGVATLEVCRPLPHIETKPQRVRSILAELFPELSARNLMPGSWNDKAKDDDEKTEK
ncbi:MAG: YcjF family protein [Hyphomicrobiaceae bacterium]